MKRFGFAVVGIIVVGLAIGAAFGAGSIYGRSGPSQATATPPSSRAAQPSGSQTFGGFRSGQPTPTSQSTPQAEQLTPQSQSTPQTEQPTPQPQNTRQAGQNFGFGAGMRGQQPRGLGQVEKVEGNTITITTQQGAIKVIVGQDTIIQKMVEGSLEDIELGQTLLVTGDRGEDGAISATTIQIYTSSMPTIPTRLTPQSEQLTPTSQSTPQTGQSTPQPQNTRQAGQNFGFDAGMRGQQPGGLGQVEKVEGNTITITTQQGAIKVIVGQDTVIQKMVEGSLEDIELGQTLLVTGDRGEDGAISATTIQIMSVSQQ